MQKQLTYNEVRQEGLSTKEKVVYSLLAAAGLTTIIIVGVKGVKQLFANVSDKKSFELGTPATYARQIKMALDNKGHYGIDEDAIRQVLRNIKSQQELEMVRREYKSQNKGNEMYRDLSALDTPVHTEFLLIMSGKPDANAQGVTGAQYRSWAMRLHYAFLYTWSYLNLPGTDEDAVKAVFLEIPTKSDYKKVEAAYFQEYGETLWNDLQLELELWELQPYMDIINSKPA